MWLIADSVFPWWAIDVATGIGVIGTIATLIGLYLTWIQVTKTKKAAEAAQAAAEATDGENRLRFARFVVGQCYRLANEAKIYIEAQRLDVAAIRANDLADSIVQLGRTLPEIVPTWEEYVSELRDWDDTLRKCATKKQPLNPTSERKWFDFHRQLLAEFDRFHGPFEIKERRNDSI